MASGDELIAHVCRGPVGGCGELGIYDAPVPKFEPKLGDFAPDPGSCYLGGKHAMVQGGLK